MDRSANFPSITVSHAFVQFLEGSSFARRTRESYAEDLKPLLTQIGQAPITALTDDVARSFLATQEALAPATYNRRLEALRSFSTTGIPNFSPHMKIFRFLPFTKNRQV